VRKACINVLTVVNTVYTRLHALTHRISDIVGFHEFASGTFGFGFGEEESFEGKGAGAAKSKILLPARSTAGASTMRRGEYLSI
jgi:hypothetical protein